MSDLDRYCVGGAYMRLPASERENLALRRELQREAESRGIPFLHEPTPGPNLIAEAMARRGIVPGGSAQPPTIGKYDQGAFIEHLEAIASGRARVVR